MGKKTYTDLGSILVEKVTAKAVLIKRAESDHWLPLSVLEPDTATEVVAKGKGSKHTQFEVEDWFIEKEEIEV